MYQNKGFAVSPSTTNFYALVGPINLRKYGNCMYRDVSDPLRNFNPNEEYVDLSTEKDCVDWCEGKKNKCLYMMYQPGAGAAGKGRCYRTSKVPNFTNKGPNNINRLLMEKVECKDGGYWRKVADLCQANEPNCG